MLLFLRENDEKRARARREKFALQNFRRPLIKIFIGNRSDFESLIGHLKVDGSRESPNRDGAITAEEVEYGSVLAKRELIPLLKKKNAIYNEISTEESISSSR